MRGLEPALLGAVGFAVGVAFNWVPFGWTDEAATVSMVTRPLDSFVHTVVRHVDAVHATYYVLLRLWGAVFGYSIPSLRVPSAIALGAATVGVWFVARRIGTGRLPLLSALLFLTVPMATWAATEARSYCFVIAAATWLTVLLLWAADGPRWRWAIYGVAATVCIYLFIYDALLIVAHVSVVLLAPSLRHNARRAVLAAAAAVLAAVPILIEAVRQQSQIAWLGTKVDMTPQNVVAEWFPQSTLYEIAAWVLILAGLVLLATGRAKLDVDRPTAIWLLLLWLALPTAALVTATLLGKPLWVQRYTLFSLPAAAILMAIACQRLRRFAVVPLIVMVVLALPTYLQQRTPMAKGVDWGYAAAFVRAHAGPQEGFYFTDPITARPPRPMLAEYRSDFDGYRDLALDATAAQIHRVWDETAPAATAASRAAGLQGVVVIGSTRAPAATAEALADFRANGFTVTTIARYPRTTAYLLSRR